jgi:hypothetical protein
LIWVNETGLTATAEVAVFHSDDEILAVRRVDLLPNPHFNKADLLRIKPAAVAALRDLASSRVVPLRFLTPDGWGAILEEAQQKITQTIRERELSQLSADEGKRRYRQSIELERNRLLVKAAKEANRQDNDGIYRCDVCAFSVDRASLFDAHHLYPLRSGERKTTVSQFAVLCPTCHRVAHHEGRALWDPLTVPEMKSWWAKRQES